MMFFINVFKIDNKFLKMLKLLCILSQMIKTEMIILLIKISWLDLSRILCSKWKKYNLKMIIWSIAFKFIYFKHIIILIYFIKSSASHQIIKYYFNFIKRSINSLSNIYVSNYQYQQWNIYNNYIKHIYYRE